MTPRAAPAPAPSTAPRPAPAPAPALVVVPAPTEEYCSILDIQFEVGQGDIQLEERERLRVIATFLEKYPDTTAVIEGHTDNVGAPATNMRLSQRRADSVVAYLRDTHDVAASRLSAVGYGDTRPLADNRTNEGKRMNRRIGAVVACATDIEGLEPLPARITMAQLIEFDTDKATISQRYHDQLRKVADYLKTHPTVTATVEGHAANSTPAMSMEISRLRARNVADYLVNDLGIARSRVSSEGFGESRRFAYNTSAEGQQENRRVNIVLNYPN
ncbi:MAG TPA: OmpA family protein [Woeseiaceae bacterium]